MKTTGASYSLTLMLLRVVGLLALVGSGWFIYSQLPHTTPAEPGTENKTTVQILLRPTANESSPLSIGVELYPVDIVAVRHEYFTERRAGKRFDDFLSERMQGRSPVSTTLDQQGQASLLVAPGNWWLHAVLAGEEELEWHLPVTITGRKQTIELNSQNVYTRTRSF